MPQLVSTVDAIATSGIAPTTANSNITGVANNASLQSQTSLAVPPPHFGATILRFQITGTADPGSLVYWDPAKWTSAPAASTYWGRVYLYVTTRPNSSATTIIGMATTAFASMHNITILSTGALQVRNGSTGVGTSTSIVPLNQWVRVEYQCFLNGTTGQTILRYYANAESNAITETVTGTAGNTLATAAATPQRVYISSNGGTPTTATFYMADAAFSDATWVGKARNKFIGWGMAA